MTDFQNRDHTHDRPPDELRHHLRVDHLGHIEAARKHTSDTGDLAMWIGARSLDALHDAHTRWHRAEDETGDGLTDRVNRALRIGVADELGINDAVEVVGWTATVRWGYGPEGTAIELTVSHPPKDQA